MAKLLAYFLINQNRVLSRDELMEAVWDQRIVSDDAINRCISILRQTLSPDDKNACIETVVRKGYVSHFPPAPITQELPETKPRKRPGVVLLAAGGFVAMAALSVIAILLITLFTGADERPTRIVRDVLTTNTPFVAVLPFVSTSQLDDSQFFAKGMHNDLLTQLAKLESLRVISSTSVQEYHGSESNIREIGEELGADIILEGSVQIVANQIRINAQLIDAKTDQHLWAESYDRELTPLNIFDVQSNIAHAITEALHTTLTEQDNQQLAIIPTQNMAAYRAYHRALQMRELDAAAPAGPEFVKALEEAVELDPTFSRAWAELVTALAYQNIAGDNPEMTLRAEEALARLKAVAPDSADYLIGQSAYIYYALKDYDQAHDILSQALKMNPSDVNAIRLRSWIERRQGNFDAWIESMKEARRLDPRNPALTDLLIVRLTMTHRYDEAWSEIEASELESFLIGQFRSLLQFREHRDFNRLQESAHERCRTYNEEDCGWIEHIAARDYPAALESLNPSNDKPDNQAISSSDLRRIFTLWLMNEIPPPEPDVQQWQEKLTLDEDDSGGFRRASSYLGAAILAGIDGNVEVSEDWIERWYKKRPFDWAERINLRAESCRILGMIQTVHATVQCLRDGLKEPSLIMPFLEPYLPFYDALRDKPEFIEMVIEMDGEASGLY